MKAQDRAVAPGRMAASDSRRLSTAEFVAMLALLISLVALSIDAMLPALGDIASDLSVTHENDRQLVVSALFLGLTVGQMIYGPLSDSIGRKPAIYIGLAFFIAGSLLAAMATSFEMLLAGRMLEGFGAAGPRIVSVALVRDLYEGRPMARIMSLAMSIFILVPVIAPALGQAIMLVAPWRAIFALLVGLAVLGVTWLALRQPETLTRERRSRLSAMRVLSDIIEVVTHRPTLGYVLATGFVFVAFVAYLQTSQQVFGELYGRGAAFPDLFRRACRRPRPRHPGQCPLVMALGMRRLSWLSLIAAAVVSILFLAYTLAYDGKPPLVMLVAAFAVVVASGRCSLPSACCSAISTRWPWNPWGISQGPPRRWSARSPPSCRCWAAGSSAIFTTTPSPRWWRALPPARSPRSPPWRGPRGAARLTKTDRAMPLPPLGAGGKFVTPSAASTGGDVDAGKSVLG